MIASGMIGMIRTYMIACHHLCPYHAYHAACDHAYPVLRSVLCALYSESQIITNGFLFYQEDRLCSPF